MSRKYKRIYCCGDCVNYNWKKHRCGLGAHEEAEPKKCPICGNDLYEYCFMCCYEEKEGEAD